MEELTDLQSCLNQPQVLPPKGDLLRQRMVGNWLHIGVFATGASKPQATGFQVPKNCGHLLHQAFHQPGLLLLIPHAPCLSFVLHENF